jgi:retinol dehydrogenase-12
MKPARLIITSRSQDKGDAAVQSIRKSNTVSDISIEAWTLDLSDFTSVKSFAQRVTKELGVVDILIENAGLSANDYVKTVDGWETCLQVNVISTFLLAIILLPVLAKSNKPKLVIVSSFVHYWSKFDRINLKKEDHFFNALNNGTKFNSDERYLESKLLDVFLTRALAEHLPLSCQNLSISSPDPGFCYSDFDRNFGILKKTFTSIFKFFFARQTEQGARTFIDAALRDDLKGEFLANCEIKTPSEFVLSSHVLQERLWNELVEILRAAAPEIKTILK